MASLLSREGMSPIRATKKSSCSLGVLIPALPPSRSSQGVPDHRGAAQGHCHSTVGTLTVSLPLESP